MARNDGIDRTLARNRDLSANDIKNAQAHNEREKEMYSNPDIVLEETHRNIHFKQPTGSYTEMFDQLKKDGVISTRGLKEDATTYCELLFDVNSAYFYNHGGPVCIGIELLGELIAAVVVEVGRIYIEQQLTVGGGITFQTSGGDYSILFQLVEHFCVTAGRLFEVDIPVGFLRYNIRVGIHFLFSFVVSLCVLNVIGAQITVSCKGTVNPVVSCHIAPFC